MSITDKKVASVVKSWEEWLENERRYADNTLKAYQRDIKQFFAFIAEYNNDKITEKLLTSLDLKCFRAWLTWRTIKRHYERSSTARAIAVVRSFYRYAENKHNPRMINKSDKCKIHNQAIFHLRTPKLKHVLPRPVSSENAVESINTIGKSTQEDWIIKRDTALLILIYGSGLRIMEALDIKRKNAPRGDSITILGKGNKERLVPILPIVVKAVNDYISSCEYNLAPDDYLFVGKMGKKLSPRVFQRAVEDMRDRLGLPENVTPHAFRHSFATHLLDGGGDIRTIQELLGHASLSTTQRYTKVDTRKLLESYTAIKSLQ